MTWPFILFGVVGLCYISYFAGYGEGLHDAGEEYED